MKPMSKDVKMASTILNSQRILWLYKDLGKENDYFG
jgi:hypothetical protein